MKLQGIDHNMKWKVHLGAFAKSGRISSITKLSNWNIRQFMDRYEYTYKQCLIQLIWNKITKNT